MSETMTDWEKEIAERNQKEIDRANEIRAKVKQVIKILEMKQKKEKNRDVPEALDRSVGLNSTDGENAGFYFSATAYGGWRLHISGNYPRDSRGQYIEPFNWNEPHDDKITVSPDKTAEQIANDIKRRLLPRYLELLERVEKKIAGSNAYEDARKANLRALFGDRKLTEYEARDCKVSLSFENKNREEGSGYGSAQIFDKSVNLELRNLDIETAKKILAMLPREV